MDFASRKHMFDDVLSNFNEFTKSAEIFVEPQEEHAKHFKSITKQLYDYASSSKIIASQKYKHLSELIINGFDEEQIFQQLELLNKSAIAYFSKIINKINPDDVVFEINPKERPLQNGVIETEDQDDFSDANSSIDNEEYAFDGDSDSSAELPKVSKSKETESKPKNKSNKNPSEVDDQFFKLSKLAEFLKMEDLREERGEELQSSDNEEEIDLFQDIPSDDTGETGGESDEDETPNVKKSSKDLMHEDFFDAPESGDESVKGYPENDDYEDKTKPMNYDPLDGSVDAMDNESIGEEDDVEKTSQSDAIHNKEDVSDSKTAFEIEQEKIRKNIQECEKSMLEPSPWQLTGEVAASNRPVDSLIHQETEFDSNVKQDFIADSVLTEKVENIIRMAIMNKAFTDVERKIKPTEEVIAYRKEVVIEQTKSKKGLAEVYEEDYLKKKSKQEEEEDPKHKEIKELMDVLFPELQALFTHIPKPAVPEIKVVSNLPAITVEEVAPTSVSDVTLLAPEEIKKKSGLVKGQTERTDTDRKRERRKKKLLQKLKQKKKEEQSKTTERPSSAKARKREKLEALKKLKQHRNTKISMDVGDKIKSSKDFFSRLQDTIQSKSPGTKNKLHSKILPKKKKSKT